jgi:hypothetical protein
MVFSHRLLKTNLRLLPPNWQRKWTNWQAMDISVEDLIEHLPLIVVMMTKLAEEDISVEEVEAMTEEEVKAYVKKNMSASLLEAHNCVKVLL